MTDKEIEELAKAEWDKLYPYGNESDCRNSAWEHFLKAFQIALKIHT